MTNQPLGGNEMPRFAGIASMFRLPVQPDAKGLDVAICGVPLDIGTSNRVGTRYGPRQIRTESVLVRPYGMATGAAPFVQRCDHRPRQLGGAVGERLAGTAAAVTALALRGVEIVRVHDVAETVQAIQVWRGLRDAALTATI